MFKRVSNAPGDSFLPGPRRRDPIRSLSPTKVPLDRPRLKGHACLIPAILAYYRQAKTIDSHISLPYHRSKLAEPRRLMLPLRYPEMIAPSTLVSSKRLLRARSHSDEDIRGCFSPINRAIHRIQNVCPRTLEQDQKWLDNSFVSPLSHYLFLH